MKRRYPRAKVRHVRWFLEGPLWEVMLDHGPFAIRESVGEYDRLGWAMAEANDAVRDARKATAKNLVKKYPRWFVRRFRYSDRYGAYELYILRYPGEQPNGSNAVGVYFAQHGELPEEFDDLEDPAVLKRTMEQLGWEPIYIETIT